jgi:hypothetical protein
MSLQQASAELHVTSLLHRMQTDLHFCLCCLWLGGFLAPDAMTSSAALVLVCGASACWLCLVYLVRPAPALEETTGPSAQLPQQVPGFVALLVVVCDTPRCD